MSSILRLIQKYSRNPQEAAGSKKYLVLRIWILTVEMLNKNSSTFRIFLCSCHPEQARPTQEGGRSRRIPIYFLCHAASGSSHKTLLNSFASVAPFAVKISNIFG